MHLSFLSIKTSLFCLLCSLSFITSTYAASGCVSGQPSQLASEFKGFKPISSYCASNYPVASTTIFKNFPGGTVTKTVVVSTATVFNGTTTETVTNATPATAQSVSLSALKRRDRVYKRDYVQEQVYSDLVQQPSILSSVCACLGATTTVTKSITATHTVTIPTTATAYAVHTQTVTVTPVSCLTPDTANYLINGFASLLTAYSDSVAEALLADDFTDTSDSINQLAPYPPGSITFPSKQAFEYGQGSQAPIRFTVLNVDNIACTGVTFRWKADVAEDFFPIKGINSLVASNLNGTDQGWQIKAMYSEFNSLGWIAQYGAKCGFGSPASNASAPSNTTTPASNTTTTTASSGTTTTAGTTTSSTSATPTKSTTTTTASTTSSTATSANDSTPPCVEGLVVQPGGTYGCQYTQHCEQYANAHVIDTVDVATYMECVRACDNDSQCEGFTFIHDVTDPNLTADPNQNLYSCDLAASTNLIPTFPDPPVDVRTGILVGGSCSKIVSTIGFSAYSE